MYNDLFTIGKFTLHGYAVMIALGYIIGVGSCLLRAKKEGKDQDVIMDISLVALIVGFLGGKLMYVIVNFKMFLKYPLQVLGLSGFVVYGGIILGLIGILIYSKIKKVAAFDYLDYMIPHIAIVQGFGRIGCFLAGCCYGAETDSFLGVVFPAGSIAPAGVKLWPTQLFSAGGDFLIAIILFLVTYLVKNMKKGNLCIIYVVLYAVGRFVVEIFRADPRGNVSVLSTSQFISIIALALAIIAFVVFNFVKKDKTGNEKAA